jgi:hypothetical protein
MKAAEPDWDDGMPMPMSPPPPARPAAKSILDADDYAPKPALPQAATAAKAPAPAPVAAQPAPPAKPPLPPAPKPPAPATAPKAVGDPDACPSCGRKSPGKPGQRYCMVCDRTF